MLQIQIAGIAQPDPIPFQGRLPEVQQADVRSVIVQGESLDWLKRYFPNMPFYDGPAVTGVPTSVLVGENALMFLLNWTMAFPQEQVEAPDQEEEEEEEATPAQVEVVAD